MKPSLRFLGLILVGWVGVRAATLGLVPGAELFRVDTSEAKAPPIVATQFAPIEPVVPAAQMIPTSYPDTDPLVRAPMAPVRYLPAAIGVPVVMRPGVVPVYQLPAARPDSGLSLPPPRRPSYSSLPLTEPVYYAQLPALTQAPFSGPVSRPVPPLGRSDALLDPRHIDRLQLSTWALLREQQERSDSPSLASGGQLGASQAGARLVYNFDRRLALSARVSSEVGRRGGEVAGGVRLQPLLGIPVWLTAERRQAVGKYGGGRSAFALFAEAGVYQRPLPMNFSLNGYVEGGVVGITSRDLFFDGALWATRPMFRNFSAGFGIWGGAQPGLYRVDAGPRITMAVRNNLKVHLDWRQRLAGNAHPSSGPAITLSGDF